MLSKKGVYLCLIIMMTVFSGCFNQGNHSFNAYYASSVENILRDQNIPKVDAKLDISLAKNEYEGGQIILKSSVMDIDGYEIVLSDLKSETSTLSKENISIYKQHYIEVTAPSNNAFGVGFYPDALIPFEKVLEYKENNFKKNQNEALWFKVYAPKEQNPGTYKGVVKIKYQEETIDVPITVTIYDFTLSDESHSSTSFNIWADPFVDQFIPGHLDSTEELYRNYYNYLLDYRISPSYLPTYAYGDPVRYAELVEEFVLNPKVSNFNLPHTLKYETINGKSYGILEEGPLKETIKEILKVSTEEKNYFKKAYLYIAGSEDEAPIDKHWLIDKNEETFNKIKLELINEYDNQGFFDDKPSVKEALKNIKHIVTIIDFTEVMGDQVYHIYNQINGWTPILTNFISPEFKYETKKKFLEGNDFWWYGCVGPKNPYPTYHLDDNRLSPRIMSWMQRQYNVTGNLYWSVNITQKYDGSSFTYRDIWNDPLAFPGANGDGYILYPGRKYGIHGPIGTMRLEMIRDGQEDYEYLYILEELLKGYNEKFGINLKLNEYIDYLYRELSINMKPLINTSEDGFLRVRDELAKLIVDLKNCPQGIVNIGGVNAINNTATIQVFAEKNASVKIDGKEITNKVSSSLYDSFIAVIPIKEYVDVEITTNGKTSTIKKFVSKDVTAISSFENDDITNIKISNYEEGIEDTKIEVSNEGAFAGFKSLKFETVGNVYAGNKYSPYLAFDNECNLPKDFKNVGAIVLYVFNDTNKEILLTIRLRDGRKMRVDIGSEILIPNRMNKVVIQIDHSLTAIDYSNILQLDFVVPNLNIGEEATILYFDNIYLEGR
ncbi:MAG: DUF4091 domain-containing protein [Acholeplasmataceae bacterium]|nr:DUF4091 domain-containing protein [Acholeplasmataceae bacterium]